MNTLCKLLTALLLFFTNNIYALDTPEQPVSVVNFVNSQVSCPATDFSVFIRAFANDVNIQKTFTKYPLKYQRVDLDSEPDPKAITQELNRNQIQFPILALHEERVNHSLEIQIDNINTNNAEITLFKPDTDYQITYHFIKNFCWYLVFVDNQSL